MFNLETTVIQQLQEDICEWSEGQFPGGTPKSCAAHLIKEVNELFVKPLDLMKYADCFMLLLDGAARAGYTTEDLTLACICKLTINKNRIWGEPDEDGVCEYIEN